MKRRTFAKTLELLIRSKPRFIRDGGKINVSKAASAIKLNQATLKRMLDGESGDPRPDNAEKLCRYFKVTRDQLVGKEPIPFIDKTATIVAFPVTEWSESGDLPDDEFAQVKRYDIKISAGNGGYVFEEVEEDQGAAFRAGWLRSRGLKTQFLRCVVADGDSMEPTIQHGSTMLVNTEETEVQDGKIYVIAYGDQSRVKRLYKLPGNGLRIRSDNHENYPDIDLSEDQAEHVIIVGRVRWYGSEA